MQRITVIGNVGKDATVKTLDSGANAISFNIAVNEKYKETSNTTWYSCTLWRTENQSTAISSFIKKGTKIYVEGKPQVRMYQDANGKTQSSFEIRVDRVEVFTEKDKDDLDF